jgi:hypothetical protein
VFLINASHKGVIDYEHIKEHLAILPPDGTRYVIYLADNQ